jgi:transcription initiation factor IIE alpha subunit
MRKLIETEQKMFIVCDNVCCDYEIPFQEKLDLVDYVDKPCPDCGDNLLTMEDYALSLKLEKTIKFINKWFSWMTLFMGKVKKEDYTRATVHVHNGINIRT